MTSYEQSPDYDLDGLARELGQHEPTFIAYEDEANDNAPRERVGLWRWFLNLGCRLMADR